MVERTPLERFEELSTEIMQLLQVQINALDELDFAMTKAPDLRECAERGEHVHQLNALLRQLRQPLPLVVDVESACL